MSSSLSVAPPSPAICDYCGEPRPESRTHYCSRQCQRAAGKARRRARDAAGHPPGPPVTPRKSGGRRAHHARYRLPYIKFTSATRPDKRVQVPETPEAQRKAELLIARGCCAYRNARGLLRDIGVPRKEEHRGKVWAAKPGEVATEDAA